MMEWWANHLEQERSCFNGRRKKGGEERASEIESFEEVLTGLRISRTERVLERGLWSL